MTDRPEELLAIQGLDPTRFSLQDHPYSFWNRCAGRASGQRSCLIDLLRPLVLGIAVDRSVDCHSWAMKPSEQRLGVT